MNPIVLQMMLLNKTIAQFKTTDKVIKYKTVMF